MGVEDAMKTITNSPERYAGKFVASVGLDFEVRSANAELIVAAPKLLAALEAVEVLHVTEGNGNCIACWDFNSDTDVKFPCPTVRAITEALR